MTPSTNRPQFIFGAAAVLASLMLALLSGAAHGDDHAGGISVTGTGTVKGKPSVVEFDARVSGEGELANDATVKYRDMKKKVTAAFDALKNPNLALEFKGSSITEAIDPQTQMRMMQGVAAADTSAPKVRVSEDLHITLNGADKLDSDALLKSVTTVIDTCRDAGIQIGPAAPSNYIQAQIEAQQGGGDSAIAQFKIPDITTLREQAYKLAIDDARANAQRLADLSGVKLGPVISIQDEGAAPASGGNSFYAMIIAAEMGGSPTAPQGDSKEVSSNSFGEIPVTVRLSISFEIQK